MCGVRTAECVDALVVVTYGEYRRVAVFVVAGFAGDVGQHVVLSIVDVLVFVYEDLFEPSEETVTEVVGRRGRLLFCQAA